MPRALHDLPCHSTTTTKPLSPSPPSPIMAFNNASHLTFTGQAFNNVSRDQVNVTAEVVHINSRADDEPTEYDEVRAPIVMYIQCLKMKTIVRTLEERRYLSLERDTSR